MSFHLRDQPIKRKLTVVILLTTTLALLLMGTGLITYELVTFRRTLVGNMNVLADIVGDNSSAALEFDNVAEAEEILAALAAEPQITAASLYKPDGSLFARYPARAPLDDFPVQAAPAGYRFDQTHFVMFDEIIYQGKRVGTIFLQADLGQMYNRFQVYGMLLLFVGAFSVLGAMSLSRGLQHRISEPVLQLARMAQAVSERQDYSIRGTKFGSDELGQLTDAFNQMLTRIGESSAALMTSEERLRLALEGSQTGTWDMNLQTGRLFWDDYMFGLYRRSKEEFDGTIDSMMTFVHPDDVARVRQEVRRALDEKHDLNVLFRVVDHDGEVRHITARGRAMYDAEGRPVRMTGVSMDVTVTKRAEEALNRAKEAAEAANKAKDEFLAVLSHELRTPLTPVLAAVAMLEEDKAVPQHIHEEIELIRRNIEVEARLIDDLLDVTAIVRGKIVLNRHLVDVRQLLEHAMQNYCSATAERKQLDVTIDVTATDTHVLADSSRMTQVFWNLLQNACKFTPRGGAIHIRMFNEPALHSGNGSSGAADHQPDLVVAIRDTGIGISAEAIPRIFDAFEQGERSRTRQFGGLGLGLAISRAIVDLHGGSLTANSEGKDRGAELIIRLRTVAPKAAEAATPQRLPASSTPAPRVRILLVEDHNDTADQLVRLLQRDGHSVTRAGDVREARRHLDEACPDGSCAFDLLVSDLGLPDGSGHDIMREVASRFSMPGIALSGYGMKEDVDASLSAGFCRHITKPVDWAELRAAIDAAVAPQQQVTA
jgi:PAS domain S-box-containing protein